MTTNDNATARNMFGFLLTLADSDLIHGQRLAALCSKGPELETDIAVSNIALDFIGQARMYYGLAARIATDDLSEPTDEDKLAYFRNEREYRNNLLVEQPNKDFAYTIVKQFLLDSFRILYLERLATSKNGEMAGIAAKARKENAYHVRFSKDWILRLGDGTEESNRKTQAALDFLWPYTADLFSVTTEEEALLKTGLVPELSALESPWKVAVGTTLSEAGLVVSDSDLAYVGGKNGIHTEILGYILAEMQYLQRTHPNLEW